VSKRRVTKIMTHPNSFDEVLVQSKRSSNRACDLRHFQCVRQARSVMVAGRSDEDLRFVLQAPKTLRVDDSIAVPLKGSSNR
jgi:hypothetical protein